nr:tetratricopeptide repeat protein [uncultured Carboxylicivirga sp.]
MDNNDRFLDFLSGELSEENQKKLAEELNDDKDLYEEFELQKEILHTIKMGDDDTMDFRNQLKDIGAEFMEEKKSAFRIRPAYWIAAASVITLLSVSTFLGLFRSDRYVGDQMFMEYYEPYGLDINVRGDSESSDIDNAISLYQSGNTDNALEEFEKLKMDNTELSGFFSALCQIELGNIDKAERELEAISTDAVFYSDHINWYLALCYLKQEKMPEAKEKFDEITKGNNQYAKRASRILKKL